MSNTFTERIRILLTGADKAAKGTRKVSDGMTRLAKSAAAAGAAYFTAQGIVSGLRTSIDLFAQQELAEKQLTTAVGRTSDALLGQASALQRVTTFGDEAIIAQQAFLASLEFTEDQIKEIIPVALDLSAATGISLESAIRNVSKTFSGLSGELGELVPQLRELTAEEMKAGKAVEVLGDLFAGQAAAQTETLAGSLEQMNNVIGDMAEKIGETLAPFVIDLAQFFGNAAEAVGDFFRQFNESTLETQVRELKELGASEEVILQLEKQLATVRRNEVSNQIQDSRTIEELNQRAKEALNEQIAAEEEKALKTAKFEEESTEQGRSRSRALAKLTKEERDFIEEKEKEIEQINEEIKLKTELVDLDNILFGIAAKQKGVDLEQAGIKTLLKTENEKNNELKLKSIEIQKKEFQETNPLMNKINQSINDIIVNSKKQADVVANAGLAIGMSAESTTQAVQQAGIAFITSQIQQALSIMVKKAFGELGFIGGLGVALGSAAIGRGISRGIQTVTAAEGFDGIVTEPTLFLAGESGAEFVDIEPTNNEGANRNGSMNITFTGNVMSQDFIESEAIPMIKKAIRKGGDIGI